HTHTHTVPPHTHVPTPHGAGCGYRRVGDPRLPPAASTPAGRTLIAVSNLRGSVRCTLVSKCSRVSGRSSSTGSGSSPSTSSSCVVEGGSMMMRLPGCVSGCASSASARPSVP
ncbi:hypothetical protein Vafri_21808, partial [Volvox africanus]